MTVELTDEQGAALLEIARRDGKSPGEVLVETAQWLGDLAGDAEERRIMEGRHSAADRGEFLTDAEVAERFERMLRPR